MQQLTNKRGYEFERGQGVMHTGGFGRNKGRENYVKDIIISKIKEKCDVRRKIKESDLWGSAFK